MSTKGSKVERHSVSNQPHELNYEAHKEGTSSDKLKETKKETGNQRNKIESKLKK
ncbi:DUF3606 domain-containing protein [Mucilaginibacter ginkgonis]|uniref:Uncharacterized protein n=1 Tax=Mucilaginibacter ginkgonis TaxID=2682091 RepID=A0A6I4HXN8_9SPHI|nr:DUF3606 domain-containing protein [Mucilaginibacter ginkgonis]QQL49431.1 hypothetical protein GO620_014840 [Mucilaginibacter ginkgonis]